MDYPGKIINKTQATPTQASASGTWTLDDAAAAVRNNNWPVAGVPNPVSRSLRFNSADSAYLNRTPGVAGNRKTWTWSGWVKRGAIDSGTTQYHLFTVNNANNDTGTLEIYFYQDTLRINGFSTSWRTTTQVFRDPSAWYHLVIAVDTTQATANNRVRLYVSGTEVTAFSTLNNPSQNADLGINAASSHMIGAEVYGGPTAYFSGYLTEINFVDGQALAATDFGMTDPNTGVWIPKKYTGTYGTNGFYLNFKDNTSTTTLGYDYSGNGNNWTTNNFSVTAGAGNDSLIDVPTPWIAYNTTGDVGGVVRGNYPVISPLDWSIVNGTLTNGNLEWTTNTTSNNVNRASFQFPTTGKFYVEFTATQVNIGSSLGYAAIGINGTSSFLWWVYASPFYQIYNGSTYATIPTISSGDVIQLAIDMDAGKAWYGQNNTWLLSGNPANGTAMSTPISFTSNKSGLSVFLDGRTGSAVNIINANFGQRPFAYTPPAGFLSLCTTNLPTPTIGATSSTQAGKYFNPVLYTGTGATGKSVSGVGFQTDFLWLKNRSNTANNVLLDSVRGITNKLLYSNLTNAEDTITVLNSVNSDGFIIDATGSGTNGSGESYVAWNWKANGAGSSNTAGSITSTVSANTTAGFSIVTYTGTGSNATVGHGLGVAPKMVIQKNRTDANGWRVWHTGIAASEVLYLNATNAKTTEATAWNSTAPTSSVFSVGTSGDTNGSSDLNVAYCFAEVAGYSAFGSYTGNGSTDGPFIYTGFRPRYVLVKVVTGISEGWEIIDAARSPFNITKELLEANLPNAENTVSDQLDFLSNGFKIRNTRNAYNAAQTYIYAAFAESPFKYANAR